MIDVTGCDGVMIGRGALRQPWIFREAAHYLATGEELEPLPRGERARIVLRHFQTLLRLRGDERIALNMIRSRMSWYSASLQPWPGLKRQAQEFPSAAAFEAFMLAGIEQIEADEARAKGPGPWAKGPCLLTTDP
jgi:tRNA-dihydrouridine synthase